MFKLSFLDDGPEFKHRVATPFSPPTISITELRALIPKDAWKKSTMRGMLNVAIQVVSALLIYKLGWRIDPFVHSLVRDYGASPMVATLVKWSLWGFCWYWQSIILTGAWLLAHEAGHLNISSQNWLNHTVGFIFHTLLLNPYHPWRLSHISHHKHTSSVENENTIPPYVRADFNLPPPSKATSMDYHELVEETPIYTLSRMILTHVLGFQFFLFTNAKGSCQADKEKPFTDYFLPSSWIFKPEDRVPVLVSDAGLIATIYALQMWTKQVGVDAFVKFYLMPYAIAHIWIIMIAYLQHADPTVPLYRNTQWSYVRGALSTIDRPTMGWVGKVFFHNFTHHHVAHHLFTTIPCYNLPIVTEVLKEHLPEHYTYDSTNSLRAIYRNFTECRFLEDEGDIVFYKNMEGQAARELAAGALEDPTKVRI